MSQLDVTNTDYMGGFQYKNGALLLFPHAEGYVNVSTNRFNIVYSYVFNYSDHLGNNRMSYTVDPVYGDLQILEENHYYPFGLKHTNYNTNHYEFVEVENGNDYYINIEQLPAGGVSNYKYKYNGKEYQDELGLNMYDYGARNYDPALGRWMNIDPLAEQYRRWSPYNYVMNSPMRFVDPDGMRVSYGDFIDNAGRESDDDYGIDKNGNVSLLKKTNDKTDKLIAENGDVIMDNIDKRILKDNINIAEDGLVIDNLDKKEDVDLNARVGDLMTRISIYEQKEISWGFYGEDKGNRGLIVIGSYINNDAETSSALSNTFGRGISLLYGNHTHPSLFDNNSYPSGNDMEYGSNAKIANYIWANNGVSQFNSRGKVTQPNGSDLARNYLKDKMKSIYNRNYLKNVLKWKKVFTK